MQNSFFKEEVSTLRRATLNRNDTNTEAYSSNFGSEHTSPFLYGKKVSETREKDHQNSLEDEMNLSHSKTMEDFQNHEEESDPFYISKRYEISRLANKTLRKPLYFFVMLVICGYLYIGVTSNAIIAGNSLKDVLAKTFETTMPSYTYTLIVLAFFLISLFIALNNINKLKVFSMFIMGCRFAIILLVMASCIYSISKYGGSPYEQIPKSSLNHITVMIGNSLFFFMSHHSIPGMVEKFYPQKNLKKLLILGYVSSLIIMISYAYISLYAFSHLTNCDNNEFPCAIQVSFKFKLECVQLKFFIPALCRFHY
jgi:hypothetical protein